MKTQIIRIEPHDDAISVKDKMGWGQTPRILLVWPARGRILNRRLDITYLKRHSLTLGAQLAFVTRDPNIRYYATIHHIPVYPNIRKAEESHWRPPRRRVRKKIKAQNLPPVKIGGSDRLTDSDLQALKKAAHPSPASWLTHPASRLFLFALGVFSVLAIGFILLPSAVIKITPGTQSQHISIPITASLDTSQVDLAGKVPIQQMSIVVEGRDSIPTSGSIEIPDRKAVGVVDLRNLTDHEVTVPAGTVISTLGETPIRFVINRSIQIDPGVLQERIPIEAIQAGESGNVYSSRILAIEGPLGLDITVTNPTATHGGSNQTSPAPSKRDYDRILEQMVTNLQDTAADELRTQLDPEDMVLEIDPDEVEILEIQYTPQEIQPSDQLQLTLRVAYQAYYVSGTDLSYLGRSISDANLPEDYEKIPTSLEITPLNEPAKIAEGRFRFDISIGWQSRAIIDPSGAIALAQWQTPEDAAPILAETLPVQSPTQIVMNPSWWPRLPILPFRISIEIATK